MLGLRQRDDKAVYNSAVLISADGKVQGVYHKVHLATGEDASGITPGDGFPVFPTPIGRIGCLICMDTMLSESSRMLALGGADIICMPIMGDLRADRFSPGQPIFNESRWKAIMRTRAIDNQVCMVVARNDVQGSCIIDRKGDILAWNEGDQEFTLRHAPGRRRPPHVGRHRPARSDLPAAPPALVRSRSATRRTSARLLPLTSRQPPPSAATVDETG